uniref:Uncharacterized protein n=1 Tax=Romanomermis culicivorax TaxID=13658 RepID=A0A915IHE6_ROMCU
MATTKTIREPSKFFGWLVPDEPIRFVPVCKKIIPPSDLLCMGAIVSNYFIATGMNCYGVTLAGGVGKLVSNWLLDGYPSQDVSKIDVARFLTAHSNRQYLRTRTPEVVGKNLRQAGAVFGEIMGYERPLYFSIDKGYPPPAFGEDFPLGKPVWYNYVSSEYQSCRERVAIMDMSNFSKFIISGPQDEVVSFLQRVCSADIDKPVGTSIFTGMQHERGGYVTDCTVNRMTQNEFFIVAPTVQQIRVKMWLHKHLKKRSGVVIQDVTSMYTALNVVGPLSRHLMQDLTDSKMSVSEFPAFWCREINVGCASGIKAVSITHCGELGWVLYVPNELCTWFFRGCSLVSQSLFVYGEKSRPQKILSNRLWQNSKIRNAVHICFFGPNLLLLRPEFALHVYQQIVDAGKSYGLQHAGYYTLRQLRIEKFYVYWGMDVDWTTTPTQCGRMFRVNFNKQFIGRQALIQEKKTGVKRRYVQLLLDDHNLHQDPWPQGGEPIYRNDKFCGLTTTAAYGFTLNCQPSRM